MTVPAATEWPVFQAFLQQVVIPGLRDAKPGATIVLDHLAAHRIPRAGAVGKGRFLTAAPAALLPRSVPIALCWSKLKTPLRTAEPRSRAASEEQIVLALDTITPRDAKGWFRHCGYSVSY
jgi:hypothetical protein